MNPVLELLDEIAAAGGRLSLAPDHKIRFAGPAKVTKNKLFLETIREHRDLIRAHLIGERTGHTLAPCTECGEAVMVAYRRATWPRCVLTPGCPGRHEPRGVDLERLAALEAPKPPTIPAPPRRPPRKRLLGPVPPFPPINRPPTAPACLLPDAPTVRSVLSPGRGT